MKDQDYEAIWNQMDEQEKASVIDTYREKTNDVPVFSTSLFDEVVSLEGKDASQLKIFLEDYNPQDKYFTWDGYDNLRSSNDIDDFMPDTEDRMIEAMKDYDRHMYDHLLFMYGE